MRIADSRDGHQAPVYHVKYIGVIDGEMGILTRKHNMEAMRPGCVRRPRFPLQESNEY